MTAKKQPPRKVGRPIKVGYNESDFLIGLGRGLGLTNDQVEQFANVNLSTIMRRKDEPFPAFVATKAAEAKSRFMQTIEMDIRAEFKRRHKKAFEVVDEALDAVDRDGLPLHTVKLKAAEHVFDRTEGKPTTRAEISADSTVTHVVQLPTELIARLDYVTQRLPQAQIAGAVEAEVVEDVES